MKLNFLIGLALLGMTVGHPAQGREIAVRMLSSGATGMMVFEPAFVAADPNDVIRFIPSNPGHNAELIPGMVPSGISVAPGAMGKEWRLTVTRPGVYGVRCTPHFALGMVALVKVGKGPAPNAATAAAVALPPLAAKRLRPMLAKAS